MLITSFETEPRKYCGAFLFERLQPQQWIKRLTKETNPFAMKKVVLLFSAFCVSILANSQDGNFHLDKTYKASQTGIIDLRSSDAKVFITGSDRKDVHVKIDRKITTKGMVWGGKEFSVEVEETNGGIAIRERENGGSVSVVGYYKEEYRIDIEAPSGMSLDIRGDDGDYFIKNINGSIALDMDDADAELVSCKGDKFKFSVDDGDIKMDQGRGRLEVRADDGDVEIRNAAFTYIDADLDDGDFIVETSLADDGEYNIQAEDGSVAIKITKGGGEFYVRHDDGRVITEGEFDRVERSEDRTRLKLNNGTAKVTIRVDDGRVRLSR